ncbi:MAG TPA: EAL domain-containing protein [Qipengyuania sp.]|nr:EAL domain-containing protein [Qipengyuania sp.]
MAEAASSRVGWSVRAAATVGALFSATAATLAALDDLGVAAIFAALGAASAALCAWLDMRHNARASSRDLAARQEIATLRTDLHRDQLTGHLNRSAFTATLTDLARSDSRNTLVSLFFFDLNRFKEVNDTLGHDIGDQLLREVGRRAAEVLGERIALARLGGDEFAAIVPYRDEAATRALAAELVETIGQPFRLGERRVEVSAAVGVAIGDAAIQGGEELLHRADLAMYEAKALGRGGHHIFDDLLSHRQMRENAIRRELATACFDERFELHYQPIVNARTGMIEKAEALLRARDHSMSGIPPSLMVSVAEDSGQIVELTNWTIDTALNAASKLKVPIAINLSPAYFRRGDFADQLIERLIEARCAPSALIVEVTEGVLIADIKLARDTIDHLRAIGIEVWLDDFGTGYSSLSYLQNFELDGIKLDRSFIQEMGRTDKATRIVRAMIDFSHSLGMKTVVEGIESEWQARILQLQGCDYLQGYELGIPMPADELAAILQRAHEEIADASPTQGVRSSRSSPDN